jgi:hypothetical protein
LVSIKFCENPVKEKTQNKSKSETFLHTELANCKFYTKIGK